MARMKSWARTKIQILDDILEDFSIFLKKTKTLKFNTFRWKMPGSNSLKKQLTNCSGKEKRIGEFP